MSIFLLASKNIYSNDVSDSKVNFLQNLPNLKNNQNNSSLSFWPYLVRRNKAI